MIKITKNPDINIIKNLNNLINKNVIVFGQTSKVRFSFEGKLEYSKVSKDYYLFSKLFQNYTYSINFLPTIVKSINNNMIELNIRNSEKDFESDNITTNIKNKKFVIEYDNLKIISEDYHLEKFRN